MTPLTAIVVSVPPAWTAGLLAVLFLAAGVGVLWALRPLFGREPTPADCVRLLKGVVLAAAALVFLAQGHVSEVVELVSRFSPRP